MRIAYLDCASGVSGDMMLGALVDAGVELAAVQAGIDSLGLPSCRLACEEVQEDGVSGRCSSPSTTNRSTPIGTCTTLST